MSSSVSIIPSNNSAERKPITLKWTNRSNLPKQAHSEFQDEPTTSPINPRPSIALSPLSNLQQPYVESNNDRSGNDDDLPCLSKEPVSTKQATIKSEDDTKLADGCASATPSSGSQLNVNSSCKSAELMSDIDSSSSRSPVKKSTQNNGYKKPSNSKHYKSNVLSHHSDDRRPKNSYYEKRSHYLVGPFRQPSHRDRRYNCGRSQKHEYAIDKQRNDSYRRHSRRHSSEDSDHRSSSKNHSSERRTSTVSNRHRGDKRFHSDRVNSGSLNASSSVTNNESKAVAQLNMEIEAVDSSNHKSIMASVSDAHSQDYEEQSKKPPGSFHKEAHKSSSPDLVAAIELPADVHPKTSSDPRFKSGSLCPTSASVQHAAPTEINPLFNSAVVMQSLPFDPNMPLNNGDPLKYIHQLLTMTNDKEIVSILTLLRLLIRKKMREGVFFSSALKNGHNSTSEIIDTGSAVEVGAKGRFGTLSDSDSPDTLPSIVNGHQTFSQQSTSLLTSDHLNSNRDLKRKIVNSSAHQDKRKQASPPPPPPTSTRQSKGAKNDSRTFSDIGNFPSSVSSNSSQLSSGIGSSNDPFSSTYNSNKYVFVPVATYRPVVRPLYNPATMLTTTDGSLAYHSYQQMITQPCPQMMNPIVAHQMVSYPVSHQVVGQHHPSGFALPPPPPFLPLPSTATTISSSKPSSTPANIKNNKN